MSDTIGHDLRGSAPTEASDVIRLYTAMRSGDVRRVGTLLDERPDLVNAREHWTRAESFAHRLPVTQGGGTPLLRAIERGDGAMVRLLIERGADVNGACTCAGGEQPLWVAVAQRETEIVDLLLDRGADPNVEAFAAVRPLDVARLRGYTELAARLEAAGAVSSRPLPFERTGVTTSRATGIKAIDLWSPFPERGLVHLTPGFGLGAVVLVSELSYRAAHAGQPVVWTGFVQAPTDLGDVHHAIAESALADEVTLLMAPPWAPRDAQLAALDAGIELAGDGAFLVVFGETGRMHEIEERLLTLSQRNAVTLVVAPLDGSVAPPRPAGSPYGASIVFDVERATRGRWPAISSDSWSKVGPSELAGLAEHARANMNDALDQYLCQPFYVAEHVLGTSGESVEPDTLYRQVAELVS